MRRNLATVLAFMLAFASASVLALGLGDIRLNSYLNQRLDAEIELVSATAGELETLDVRLADRQTFERQGIPRLPELNSLQFRVVRRPNGTSFVKITSTEPMKEPFLTFLVEVEWSGGRLLREYTLLLDPPTFKDDREAIQQEQASAPAVPAEPTPSDAPSVSPSVSGEPTPADILRGEPVDAAEAVAEEQDEPVQLAREEGGDVVSVPALEEDLEEDAGQPVRREPPRATSLELGGNYGPIQRRETLWGIAQRLRPDSSITMNQMMLAIYRANPEAFVGNINRMKAGYILRIPEYDEITSLSAGEAFREAKRQNEDWRGDASGSAMFATEAEPVSDEEAEPTLSLVAPEESEEPELGMDEGELGAGGESGMADSDTAASLDPEDDIDTGAVDLGVEETGEERLGDIESETLQAMQDSESTLPDTESTTAADTAGAEGTEELDLPPLPDEAGEDEGLADVAPLDGEPVDETADETTGETLGDASGEMAGQAADETEATPQQPDSRMAAPVRPAPAPSLVDRVLNFVLAPLGMAVLGAVLLLLILVALLMRKRRSDAAKQAAAEMSGWDAADFDSDDATVIAAAEDETESDDATVTAAGSESDEDDFQGMFGTASEREEDTGTQRLEDDTEATQMLSEAERDAAKEADDDFTDTMVGGETQMLDENDPLSEADFHMAYGLYDQAAEVVEKAIGNNPGSKELKVKLAEIHFAADNKDGFIEAAQSLHGQVGSNDADWSNIAIMGRQIAGDNPLFTDSGSGASVDLDFAAASEEEGDAESGGSMDFDIPPEEPPKAEAGSGDEIDFDMDFGTGDDNAAEETATAESSSGEASGEDFDFDMNLGEPGDSGEIEADSPAGESPASSDRDTQTEFDKALQELSAYVDTNAPGGDSQAAEESGGDLNLDEFSFDSESESADSSAGEDFGDDEEGELGEIGTKLDLARAYIDMGDPDGARSILEEVVAEGDDEQKQEAQDLINQLA